MLTENEKKKIIEEEIFRDEIRKEIESKKDEPSGYGKIWKFLNTSFALWFLSTVVVGLVTISYSSIKTDNEKLATTLEIRRKLNLEINHRIQNSITFLQSLKKNVDSTTYFSKGGIAKRAIGNLDFVETKYIFPEFKERNFISLLFELQSITPKNELKNLNEAVTLHKNLYKTSVKEFQGHDNILSSQQIQLVINDFDEVIKILEKELTLTNTATTTAGNSR